MGLATSAPIQELPTWTQQPPNRYRYSLSFYAVLVPLYEDSELPPFEERRRVADALSVAGQWRTFLSVAQTDADQLAADSTYDFESEEYQTKVHVAKAQIHSIRVLLAPVDTQQQVLRGCVQWTSHWTPCDHLDTGLMYATEGLSMKDALCGPEWFTHFILQPVVVLAP